MECLQSIKGTKLQNYEIIIVNDGSTDTDTLRILEEINDPDIFILHQKNKGLSAARNTGISNAKGSYILPLDCDNLINRNYLTIGVDVLSHHDDVDVVYGDSIFFGDVEKVNEVGNFNLQRLMLGNYIDACVLVRKTVFEKWGGFDEHIKDGMEDWELWLRTAFNGGKFYYINQPCFFYRIRSNSMMRTTNKNFQKLNAIENYVNKKFPDKMGAQWVTDNFIFRFKASPFKILVKLLIRSYFPNWYSKLLNNHKIRNGI
jgi:glycosyltransferase involved in cell wall biosynthesis